MDMNKIEFGKRLKELRESKKLKCSELGELMGFSQVAITYWENGRSEPKLKDLLKLCEIFEVSIDYLLGFNSVRYNNVPPEYETVLYAAKNANINPEQLIKLIEIIDSKKYNDNSD